MSLRLRCVEEGDRDLLYEWVNDDTVRANAFHTEKISYEGHVQWFEKMMADASVHQYILCDGVMPVGQIRLNVEQNEAFIDYSVSPSQRGKGYGSKMLQMVQTQLFVDKISRVTKLIGQVKYGNYASAKAFEKCGFLKKEMPEYVQYEKVKGALLNENYYSNN